MFFEKKGDSISLFVFFEKIETLFVFFEKKKKDVICVF